MKAINGLRSLFVVGLMMFAAQVAYGANPLTTVTWNAFSGATEYVVGIADQVDDLNTPGTVALKTASAPAVASPSIQLKDVMGDLADGNYRLQVRAKVGEYFTAWSTPSGFAWTRTVPGAVTGITFTG